MANIRLQAESLQLSGYTRENQSFASGGALAKLISSRSSGTIRGTLDQRFNGGNYDIDVSYFDENDGTSDLEFSLGGKPKAKWTLNQNKGGSRASSNNRVTRTVASNVSLSRGETFEIKGYLSQGELARVDYIEFRPKGGGSTPPAQPPSNPGNDGSGNGGNADPTPAPSDLDNNFVKRGGVFINLDKQVKFNKPLTGAKNNLRFMPLGDSITAGQHRLGAVPGGWRIEFEKQAIADGLKLNYVGNESNGSRGLRDRDHSGDPGRSIRETQRWVSGNLTKYPADAILLMIGTNDANGGATGEQMRSRLSDLIDEITSRAPQTNLLVSTIPPVDAPRASAQMSRNIARYNSLIPGLVKEKANQGKNVSFVDGGRQLSVGDINGDNSSTRDVNDGLHPTLDGYDKLGKELYDKSFRPTKFNNRNIRGTGSQDVLIGDSRNNMIVGNGSRDSLTGGGGADSFFYKRASDGGDVITDFSSNDVFRISARSFGGGLNRNTKINSSNFVSGKNPFSLGRRATFLFDTDSNVLSFDKNGSASGGISAIATLNNGYDLQANQIQLV